MSCLTPFQKKDDPHKHKFPCGKCPPCLKRRQSGWSFRLQQEEKRASSSLFVTLTYNTHNVPISKKGFMTLNKEDVQKFFKRLRKISAEKIKYYNVGEYGGRTQRPHYHLIIFNSNSQDIENSWKIDGKPIGDVHFGTVTGASIGYCLKYMEKKKWKPKHQNDDRSSEYSTFSKGLGANYLTDNMQKWHKSDLENRMYLNIDGKKIAMPRYYKDKMYTENERKIIAFFSKIKAEQLNVSRETEHNEKYGDRAEIVRTENDLYAFQKMYRNSENRDTQ